jgi:tRNA modification GTPase
MTDTIFALATPPGRSAVAVVRMSGPDVRRALEVIGAGRAKPRRAAVRTLRSADGGVLDRGLVLWFPGPASYTGEDCAEVQMHGGTAVVDAMMLTLADAGLRLARPGEFTRRAFQNGKLDLGQAEAVADLIDAESTAQARQAIQQLEGALSGKAQDSRWLPGGPHRCAKRREKQSFQLLGGEGGGHRHRARRHHARCH